MAGKQKKKSRKGAVTEVNSGPDASDYACDSGAEEEAIRRLEEDPLPLEGDESRPRVRISWHKYFSYFSAQK